MMMLKWFRRPTKPVKPEPVKPECKHRWRMFGYTTVGAVTCEHCGLETGLNIALDPILDKLQG
jgi:hypothetical protein